VGDLLTAAEEALLRAAVAIAPGIGRLIARAISGDEAAVRRVNEILPETSASQAAADELRRGA